MQDRNLDPTSLDRPQMPASDNLLVCTLTDADYRDRATAWLKLGTYIKASGAIPGGLTFAFARALGLRDSLAQLVRLEAECCAWMTFAIAESPTAVELSITSNSEDGERGIHQAFAPLARSDSPLRRRT